MWAPVALIVLQALQVVVAPVPGQLLAAVAGYLFGPWWGTLYNMIGITVGSTTAFWLSRRFGRAYIKRIIHDEVLETFDGFVERHGLLSLFLLFLIPGLPDDALCFLGDSHRSRFGNSSSSPSSDGHPPSSSSTSSAISMRKATFAQR